MRIDRAQPSPDRRGRPPMTLAGRRVDIAATGLVVTATPQGLAAIHRPETAAAIWRRHPAPGFQSWIDGLDPALLPAARVILRPAAARAAVAAACDSAGTPAGGPRDRLIDDIAALADLFAELVRATVLQLRLDVMTTDACRRFHVDRVTARLVCTYRGSGTQYGFAADGREPEHVHAVPTGAAMVLRGTLWPPCPDPGLRHRSPPIAGTGETRLVLVLDPAVAS